MFSNRSFKTLINTSNLINISTSMTMLGKLDTFNDGFKTLLDTEYFENIATRLDDKSSSRFSNSRLVYSMNGNMLQYDNTDLIINLLLQIRAIQNGQNSFVRSVSTVKDQVIDQLQRELLFAKSYLNDSQINQIKVIIGNSISSEDDFNKLLSSLYKNLKKKIVETDKNKKLNNISYNSIEDNYDPLTKKVLKNTENAERLSTRVNLINIETNKEQVEELKVKLSEKLNRVYKNNIEESVRDSYEVLSKKEVDEKVLDRVIENIKLEEKETLKTLEKEEKQKEVQRILRKELEQIYKTDVEQSLKDTKEVLTKNEVNTEVIERLLSTTNTILDVKEKLSKQKKLNLDVKGKYDPLTEKVLKNTEKAERLSTRVNLVNIETNKGQIEELKVKLSEKLNRVYKNNIEESVRDSYEVLSKKEVDEKVLDRVIENIKLEEKETLKTLEKEEKQKEVQRILRKELEQIYKTDVEQSLKDTKEILTKNQINKELIERLCKTTNTILNARKEIKNDYNPLIKKILNKTENAEVLNKKVNLINIETNNENVSFLKNIKNVLETNTRKNTYRIINKGINVLNDEYISNFAYNKNSNNETIEKIENEYLDKIIKKYKINTVFKETNTKSMRREINSKRLNYLKSEPSKLEDTLGIVGSKLSNMVPVNKKMSILDTNKIIGKKLTPEDNTYADTPSFSKVYYNDAVEHLGKNFLTGVSGSLGNDLSQPGKLVHKAPIKLPEPKEDDKDMYEEGQSVLESQLLGKSYPSVPEKSNYNQLSSNRNVMNEEKTKRLIRDYVSDLDLDIDSISRKVMNRIEKMMKTDRRRFGMFR